MKTLICHISDKVSATRGFSKRCSSVLVGCEAIFQTKFQKPDYTDGQREYHLKSRLRARMH